MKPDIIAIVGIFCFVFGIAVENFRQYIIKENNKIKYKLFCEDINKSKTD